MFGEVLSRIDGRGYSSYKRLAEVVADYGWCRLRFVRIQSDPYAKPSVMEAFVRVRLPRRLMEYSVPVADALARRLSKALSRFSAKRGEGHSGFLGVPPMAPVMVRRSVVEVAGVDWVVARFWVGLPSRSRRVLGRVAARMLDDYVPRALREAILEAPAPLVEEYVRAWIEQEYLRRLVVEDGGVAFIGDGSVLPRRCGYCHEPLEGAAAFRAPSSMAVEYELPTGRRVRGMLLKRGLSVITGPAFHGKTTVIEALAQGFYNHIPGDGRELVVTDPSVVLVRAEDGRSVECVDISSFIGELPGGHDVVCFSTRDASGATSTAAAIQEAVEAGSRLILVDEDYVAVNILYYDDEAQRLVRRKTVTTLVEQARDMTKHVSLIIVSQGSAKLLREADQVVVMEDFAPRDATGEARQLPVRPPRQHSYRPPRRRRLVSAPRIAKPRFRGGVLRARGLGELRLDNPHLVEPAQYNTVAKLLARLEVFEGLSFPEIVERVEAMLAQGFTSLDPRPGPDYSWIRGIDFIYVLNRFPGIRVEHA